MQKRNLTFLSYASEDYAVVENLYFSLKKRQVKVWLDKKDMNIGRWLDQITSAISCSKTFIFCMSTAAMKKLDEGIGIQKNELRDAYEIAKNQPEVGFNILPVRFDNCDRGDHRLSQFNQFDLFEENWEAVIDKIAIHIGGKSLSNPQLKDTRTDEQITFERLIGKIEAHAFANEYSAILALINNAFIDHSHNSEKWCYIGHMMSTKEGSHIAIEAFEHALDINPSYADAFVGKGNVYYRLGEYSKALEQYDIAIKINPKSSEAFVGKGNVLRKTFRKKDAIEQFDAAISMGPELASAFNNKGLALLELGHYEKAIKEFNNAIKINPNLAPPYNHKGLAFCELGEYEEAIKQYDLAIKIDPKYANAYENKGSTLEKLNRTDEANATFSKALELDHDSYKKTLFLSKRPFCSDESTAIGVKDESKSGNRGSEISPGYPI